MQDAGSSETASFSRRRVVTGVAWSLPVIATAIAAPAAAASPAPVPTPISATATWSGTGTQYSMVGGGNPIITGTHPTTLSIKNTGVSSFTGTISVTISLKPVGTVLAGIGVESLGPATVSSPSAFTLHGSTASFSYSGSIASAQTVDFSILFHYESVKPKPNRVKYSYEMTTSVAFTKGGGGTLSLSPSTTNPTITY